MKSIFQHWAAREQSKSVLMPTKWWKGNYIGLEMLNRVADNGDLVIFNGNRLSKEEESVAVLLRFANGDLVYVSGKQVFSWDYFV